MIASQVPDGVQRPSPLAKGGQGGVDSRDGRLGGEFDPPASPLCKGGTVLATVVGHHSSASSADKFFSRPPHHPGGTVGSHDAHRPDRPDARPAPADPAVPDQLEREGRRSTTSSSASSADGVVGWGECASPGDPYYCPETTETCWHILKDFLGPLVLGRDWETIDELVGFYRQVKGNSFAKAGLEMACWDALGRARGRSRWSTLLGGLADARSPRASASGSRTTWRRSSAWSSSTSARDIGGSSSRSRPGQTWTSSGEVRERYPGLPLQVDANSAYTLDDVDHAQAARRVRPAPDRAAAGPRRHHRPRPAPGGARRRRSASTRASTRPTTRGRRSTWGPAG